MSTLLLRLAAPLQSWGVDAKFDRRGTERVPSKSAVIGLVAAALGRRRTDSVDDLLALRFGVRVDKEGVLLRDYHTARSKKSAYVTQRYYLADAVFLAGLEGDLDLLTKIEHALRHPAFPLFLGRRSCPPEGRISLGIRNKSLLQALQEEPWLVHYVPPRRGMQEIVLRIVMDAEPDSTHYYYQRDVPISFSQAHRKFGFRRVSESMLEYRLPPTEIQTQHDPMLELEEE